MTAGSGGAAGEGERAPADGRFAAGRAAEDEACRFLAALGMAIVGRNVRSGGGEIDVVARLGRTLVFVEVRSRAGSAFGAPEETVGHAKRRRVAAAARAYLRDVPPSSWDEARFDVVAVEGEEGEREVRHYPNAFDGTGKVL